jgi:hypothetical protein
VKTALLVLGGVVLGVVATYAALCVYFARRWPG